MDIFTVLLKWQGKYASHNSGKAKVKRQIKLSLYKLVLNNTTKFSNHTNDFREKLVIGDLKFNETIIRGITLERQM